MFLVLTFHIRALHISAILYHPQYPASLAWYHSLIAHVWKHTLAVRLLGYYCFGLSASIQLLVSIVSMYETIQRSWIYLCLLPWSYFLGLSCIILYTAHLWEKSNSFMVSEVVKCSLFISLVLLAFAFSFFFTIFQNLECRQGCSLSSACHLHLHWEFSTENFKVLKNFCKMNTHRIKIIQIIQYYKVFLNKF